MQHLRFAIGNNVAYAEQQFPNVVWKADYRVVSILPADEHGPRYKIRCNAPLFDRLVREQELSPVPVGVSLRPRSALAGEDVEDALS